LAESVVEKGPLAGSRLEDGTFMEPELAYDGKSVLFSWVQEGTRGGRSHRHADNAGAGEPKWEPSRAYHIFWANLDGTGLVQLTQGGWNDLHPCFLPNGRIAFTSERRGGYGRCARWHMLACTLFSMAPDGSDIRPLSYHETNEWHPAVTQDGMIIYTRWDYVDREDVIAHHPWITTPDGCDPRALHGNYPPATGSARPNMEMAVRAIPGSPKYVAVAAPHHGQAFGSLVQLDFSVPDDGQVSQVRRITPEAPFPEVEYHPRRGNADEIAPAYGPAFPLSEDLYLCCYQNEGDPQTHKRTALYLLDTFGNRTVVYADADFDCVTPLPVRAVEPPPVVPQRVGAVTDAANAAEGVVTCLDVYNGTLPWPEGTQIKSLRVMQLYPKTTYMMDEPLIGIGTESLAHGVVGTVPVEKDGSVSFRLPAGKLVYFQALDEEGLAVQSMRSATYVKPGERLTCHGCQNGPMPPLS
jgi:hypothetical protein